MHVPAFALCTVVISMTSCRARSNHRRSHCGNKRALCKSERVVSVPKNLHTVNVSSSIYRLVQVQSQCSNIYICAVYYSIYMHVCSTIDLIMSKCRNRWSMRNNCSNLVFLYHNCSSSSSSKSTNRSCSKISSSKSERRWWGWGWGWGWG